jgi:hypothetical protein
MNIDVYSIDKKIRDIWLKNNEKIESIQAEIKQYKDILESNIDISEYVIHDIEEKITLLESDCENYKKISENQHFYTIDFTDLIQTHRSLPPKKISFVSKQKNDETDEFSKKYIDILKKYDIDYDKDVESHKNIKKVKKKCTNCKTSDQFIITDQNFEICEECGKQDEQSFNSVSFKDIARVNLSNKYTYERRVHFKDCINQYQGKQNATIDDKVYADLEEQFALHGLLKGDKSTPKKTRFENITKEHISLFLKETGHTKHYEDVVLIYHNMTGKKVDDISHIENQLMEDFDKISNLYDKTFKFTGKIERKSFINTQYVLFQLLRHHRYPCKKEDFNMLKTLDRKSFHDDIIREIFQQLNFNFTPIF